MEVGQGPNWSCSAKEKYISILDTVGLRVPAQYIRDLLRAMSALRVQIFIVLDSLQLLMVFARTLTYLEQKLFLLVLFCNCTFIINKILIVLRMNSCTYFFSPHNGWRDFTNWSVIVQTTQVVLFCLLCACVCLFCCSLCLCSLYKWTSDCWISTRINKEFNWIISEVYLY
jgi:hypothetical protein